MNFLRNVQHYFKDELMFMNHPGTYWFGLGLTKMAFWKLPVVEQSAWLPLHGCPSCACQQEY